MTSLWQQIWNPTGVVPEVIPDDRPWFWRNCHILAIAIGAVATVSCYVYAFVWP